MKDTTTTFIVLSLCYIISYSLTSGFIYPLQTTLLPNISDKTGLLFLPHGVRIIAVYYFGWRAILYLLPSSYLMWWLSAYGQGVELGIYQPIVSLVACYAGVKLAETALMVRQRNLDLAGWKLFLIAGILGSVLNGVGLTSLESEVDFAWHVLGYVVGDVAGLFVSLLLLLYGFKFLRHYRTA